MQGLENLSPRDLEAKFYELCHQVNTHERAFRSKESVFKNLDMLKDETLAELTRQAPGKSNAEKERNARLTAEWREFKRAMLNAEHVMLDAKVEFKIRLRNWETCRSILSSRNTERRTSI